jgi:hypothetical protein
MAWFFHAVEQADRRWACRHGMHTYDHHEHLTEAVAHLRAIATEHGPAQLVVHHLDGSVEPATDL